jgi:acylphosphatase
MNAAHVVRLLIAGRVQGVGYRISLQREARARHLDGWVRNRSDGRVEALIAGPAERIDSLLDWARQGPPGAQVTEVLIEEALPETAPPRPGNGFTIAATL